MKLTKFVIVTFAMVSASVALGQPADVHENLDRDGDGISIFDGAISASCELYNRQGAYYTGARIVARNNINRLVKCSFWCKIPRGGGGTYDLRCQLSIPGGQSSMCGGDTNIHDYKEIEDGGYTCQ